MISENMNQVLIGRPHKVDTKYQFELSDCCSDEWCEHLEAEWDYARNHVTIHEVFRNEAAADEKWAWKCSQCGVHWLASLTGRIDGKFSCPKCRTRGKFTSGMQVRCIETGQIYPSRNHAGKLHGSNGSGIAEAIRVGKTIGGVHFEYVW